MRDARFAACSASFLSAWASNSASSAPASPGSRRRSLSSALVLTTCARIKRVSGCICASCAARASAWRAGAEKSVAASRVRGWDMGTPRHGAINEGNARAAKSGADLHLALLRQVHQHQYPLFTNGAIPLARYPRPRFIAAYPQPTSWHTLTHAEGGQALQTGTGGLSDAEAARRIAQYGPNRLVPPKRRGPLLRLLMQFHNVLLYVMMGAAVITAFLGHWIDTGVLLAAVVINAILGFVQEGKAEAALDAIRAMLSPRATVIRDGSHREIDAADLVPGDLVALVSVKALRVEEAALTGESQPVEKTSEAVDADTPLGDRYGMAYSGTVVMYGQATVIVVATSCMTELGKINQMIAGIRILSTPLLRQIDRFGRVLALAIIAMSAATFVLGVLWRNHAPSEMFMMVVALAASAIPEGLPAIMTVTLALGVQRMARRKAIIRRLPAVETLGSVTVICSDKTGTLTRNEMTVQRVICADHVFEVGGIGYAPGGDFSLDGNIIDADHYPALSMATRASVLCNDARLREEDGVWRVEGDPTEGALLVLGGKAGFTQHVGDAAWPRIAAIPFESQHRILATHHRDSDGEPWIFVKGAPERILDVCAFQMNHDGGTSPLDVDTWQRMATATAAQGLRLLALACKRTAPEGVRLSFADVETGYTLLALVGLIDPPREEAIRAVHECHLA